MAAGKAENAAEAVAAGSMRQLSAANNLMSDSPKGRGAMWKWTRKPENKPVPPTPSAAPPERSIPSQESVQAVPIFGRESRPRCNTHRKVDRD